MSRAAMDPDATRNLPAVDERAMDPDATRTLPSVDDDILDPAMDEGAVDADVSAADGAGEVLTGEIVMRDAAPGALVPVDRAEPGAEGWLVDEALFPARPPITSHRRAPGVTVPLIMAVIVVLAGAVAWVAVGHLGHGVAPVSLASPRTVDVGGPPGAPSASPSGATDPGPQATVPPVGGRPPRSTPGTPTTPSSALVSSSAATPPPTAPSTPQTQTPLETAAPVLVATPTDGLVVRVVSLANGQAMSVGGNLASDGAPIVTSTAATTVEQWKLASVMANCFYLINQGTGKALDETSGSRADGTPMQQWSYGRGNVNQMWCLRSLGSGQFSIQSIRTGSLLDLRDGGVGGGVVQQWSGNSRAPDRDQTWVLSVAG